jgi:hypothetical protein
MSKSLILRPTTVNITPAQLKSLRAIALELRCIKGIEPNISQLMRDIADGELQVIRKEKCSTTQKEN